MLSPAKDLLCGIEAVKHGADAVYIGAPRFSARSAAGNTIDDIERLIDFAHIYNVRVYAALNTILTDEELVEAERLIHRLYRIGTDALIIQDMGILGLDLPPIALHASTQMDNRTVQKVQMLEAAGFSQVVLARELSLEQIREMAAQTSVALEVFVHGALCVCFSGQCYLSEALCGRSANRGQCAQYCRLPYTLADADGQVIVRNKHLLSLKDLNRSAQLEALLDAGVSSFKIEGRLKEAPYVKNITAYYRQALDAVFRRRPEYRRTSDGESRFTFEPAPEKSFNRGFTSYFLEKRTDDITSFDTPKSIGEPVGQVRQADQRSFTVAGSKPLHNGDGLVFFNRQGVLEGFRINRVDDGRVFPAEMPPLAPGTPLFRNFDHAFDKKLSGESAGRKIPVTVAFTVHSFGFSLRLEDASGARVIIAQPFAKEIARNDQRDNITRQLSKLGNTPFEAKDVQIRMDENRFVPSSLLSEMRRKAVECLISVRKWRLRNGEWKAKKENNSPLSILHSPLTYLSNVANQKAAGFYRKLGATAIEPAFEVKPREGVPLMFTKHCLRYSLGVCPVHQKGKPPLREPLYLLYKDTKLRLDFDCKACQMLIYKTDS